MRTLFITLTVFCVWCPSALAMDGVAFLRQAYSRLSHLGSNPKTLSEKVAGAVDELFDTDALLDLSLVDIRDKMQEQELADFRQLFGQVFLAQVSKKGMRFSEKRLEHMTTRLKSQSGDKALGEITGDSGKKRIELLFYLRRDDGNWKIEDLSANGAKLSRNYRGQFNRIFREEHFEGLMARLNLKLQKLKQ